MEEQIMLQALTGLLKQKCEEDGERIKNLEICVAEMIKVSAQQAEFSEHCNKVFIELEKAIKNIAEVIGTQETRIRILESHIRELERNDAESEVAD